MSNYHAVATVTATLQSLLYDSLSAPPFGEIRVTAKPPDKLEAADRRMRLNLFLYHSSPNTAYQTIDLPTRDGMGRLEKKPVLALNLHYLLTADTADKDDLQDIQCQQILAKAMLTLHENPIITRKMISDAFERIILVRNPRIPAADTVDTLADQIELLKISILPQSLEEMTKLWSAFFQTHYRLSVSCLVTAVLLDSKKVVKPRLPVQNRKLYVLPFKHPVIERIEPQIVELTADARIKVIGNNLLADGGSLKVLFGTISSLVPKSEDVTNTEITTEIPKGLTAGVKPVQVVHSLTVGEPPSTTEHENWSVSNTAAFVLAPRVVSISPATTPIVPGTSFRVTIEPAVSDKQNVAVFIGSHMFDVKLPSSTSIGAIRTLPPLTIPLDFAISGASESFLVRVRVDGADSFVHRDDVRSSRTFGKYLPFIEIRKR